MTAPSTSPCWCQSQLGPLETDRGPLCKSCALRHSGSPDVSPSDELTTLISPGALVQRSLASRWFCGLLKLLWQRKWFLKWAVGFPLKWSSFWNFERPHLSKSKPIATYLLSCSWVLIPTRHSAYVKPQHHHPSGPWILMLPSDLKDLSSRNKNSTAVVANASGPPKTLRQLTCHD